MTTLFHFASPVQSTRPFGLGVLPATPSLGFEPSLQERAWAAETFDRLAVEDSHFDRQARDARLLARLESGPVL
jgi:hypothetical protein